MLSYYLNRKNKKMLKINSVSIKIIESTILKEYFASTETVEKIYNSLYNYIKN